MGLLKLMGARYSCRRYSDKKVEEEDLLKILEAGRLAPTAHNNQPQRIFILQSEEAKAKLFKDFLYNFKAPCYIVCGYKKNEAWLNTTNNKSIGDVDVAIVMTHMLLMIEELGLGACWIAHFDPELVRKNLEISEDIELIGVLSLGYHREDDRPSRLHTKSKSKEELVAFL